MCHTMLYKYSTVKADYQICTAGGSRPVNTTITACKDAKRCTSNGTGKDAKHCQNTAILQYYTTEYHNHGLSAKHCQPGVQL